MIALALAVAAFAAEPLSVEGIMARVAANQERAQELRTAFVYRQSLLLRFQRGDGRLAREEQHEFTVAPKPDGSEKTLEHFAGKYERDGKLVDYAEPGFKYKDLDLDGELMHDFADELTHDRRSRDGIARDLFPLTAKEQEKYTFRFRGREDYRGRRVYRIEFEPNKKRFGAEDGTPWAGEILVDAEELQPVRVTTRLARGIPFLVQSLLGTNVRGVGFDLSYEKFDDGLWFPVRYGGEFELRAVFLYKRKIAIVLRNADFRRAQVATRISFQQ
jgi:hypothetical protein